MNEIIYLNIIIYSCRIYLFHIFYKLNMTPNYLHIATCGTDSLYPYVQTIILDININIFLINTLMNIFYVIIRILFVFYLNPSGNFVK